MTELSGALMADAFERASRFTTDQGGWPTMAGVNVAADGQRLFLASTDGVKVFHTCLPVGGQPVATPAGVVAKAHVLELIAFVQHAQTPRVEVGAEAIEVSGGAGP